MARKRLKMGKKALCLIFAFLLSIESFGAVVSSSDGGAFVTKQEFEDLKTDFDQQIERYNKSIDNKIDGKIAEWLAGISVSHKSKVTSPVTNYSSIRWVPNFKVYGKWRKWTNNTTKTENTTNSWFTPSLAEKRWAWRGQAWTFWDHMEHAWGMANVQINMNITKMYDGMTLGQSSFYWDSGPVNQSCPTLVVRLNKNSAGEWVLASDDYLLWNAFVGANANFAKVHVGDKIDGDWIYNFTQYMRFLDMTLETPSGNEYLRYKIHFSGNDSDSIVANYRSRLYSDNMDFPFLWRQVAPSSQGDFGTNPNASITTNSNYIQNSWFNTGCTWHWLDGSSYSNQLTLFRNMMLGSNYDQDVNVAKYKNSIREGFAFDMSESTSFASMDFTVSNVCISNPAYVYPLGDGRWAPSGLTGTLKVPHWPTYKLRDLTSGLFKNNGTNLKIGQGLPLYIEAQKTGDLQITFDYDINYLLNSTSYKTSQSLYIDLKKGDFMDKSTKADDFFTGYNAIVDSTETTLTAYKYQNYPYPQKTGKATITIPVTKGESVWLRVRPQNETGGYYARITKLDMYYITID